jgi:hypothetical protein
MFFFIFCSLFIYSFLFFLFFLVNLHTKINMYKTTKICKQIPTKHICSPSFDSGMGGAGKKKPLKRYHCDVWLFNINTETWSQPTNGIVNTEGELIHPWDFCPTPRGSHGATLVEEIVYADSEELDENGQPITSNAAAAVAAANNAAKGVAATEGESYLRRRLFIFGGYGDAPGTIMFGRADYNDLHALDLDTWEWEEIETTGEIPEERSSCQVVYIPRVVPPNEPPTAPRIYVSGGWNSMNQFQDVYVLDIETKIWSVVTSASAEKW